MISVFFQFHSIFYLLIYNLFDYYNDLVFKRDNFVMILINFFRLSLHQEWRAVTKTGTDMMFMWDLGGEILYTTHSKVRMANSISSFF